MFPFRGQGPQTREIGRRPSRDTGDTPEADAASFGTPFAMQHGETGAVRKYRLIHPCHWPSSVLDVPNISKLYVLPAVRPSSTVEPSIRAVGSGVESGVESAFPGLPSSSTQRCLCSGAPTPTSPRPLEHMASRWIRSLGSPLPKWVPYPSLVDTPDGLPGAG